MLPSSDKDNLEFSTEKAGFPLKISAEGRFFI